MYWGAFFSIVDNTEMGNDKQATGDIIKLTDALFIP